MCAHVSLGGGQGFFQEVGVLHGLLRRDPTDGVHGQQFLKLEGQHKKGKKNINIDVNNVKLRQT